ncbi:hypothetical protein ACLKMY_35250 [Paraburkholderia mimosarum]|uniref:hypothetical protein n=1 Tax=Paraburkholderia mimosarum TaxID=312026 RepID=UPI0012B51E45|nr:hypothetical protein [Paraburkholderia mimosarum]
MGTYQQRDRLAGDDFDATFTLDSRPTRIHFDQQHTAPIAGRFETHESKQLRDPKSTAKQKEVAGALKTVRRQGSGAAAQVPRLVSFRSTSFRVLPLRQIRRG